MEVKLTEWRTGEQRVGNLPHDWGQQLEMTANTA